MALSQTITTSFKSELFQGVHNVTVDTLKLALFTDTATLGADTAAYTTSGEAAGGNYVAGGLVLTGVTLQTVGTTVILDFNDVTWTGAITARGALIYNSSKANRTIAVLDFGATKISTSVFTVQLPAPTVTTALIRI